MRIGRWKIQHGQDVDTVRRIRDEIDQRVQRLVSELLD